MSFKATQSGKRGVRLKRAMYNILEEWPEGISSSQMMYELKQTNVKKFVSSTSQIGQTLCRMPGVVKEMGHAFNADGSKRGTFIYILKYPEEFLEWIDDLEIGSV